MSAPRNPPRLRLDDGSCWLAQLQPQQAQLVVDYYRRNQRHLQAWEPTRSAAFFTERHWRGRLRKNRVEFQHGLSLRLFIVTREQTRVLGVCNFSEVVRGAFLSCFLGYSVDAEMEGRGVMGQALEVAVPYAFESLQIHRIAANYQPHNLRSARLLRRLGFVVEGYARDYLFLDGEWRDHVLTARYHPMRPA